MKKLLRVLAGTCVSIGLMAGAAAAQAPNCSITNGNGTGSTNTCTFENDVRVNFSCRNDVAVNITNDQDADSGNATANGNTTVGNVGTGGASNNANIVAEVNAACAKAKTSSTTTTTTPPAGGQGGGSVQSSSTTASAAGVTSLPATGSETVLVPFGIGAVVLGGLAAVTQLGVAGYRRLVLR